MIRRLLGRLGGILVVLYVALTMVPATWWWYEPGRVVVKDSVHGVSPEIEYWRDIKVSAEIRFEAIVRGHGSAAPVCRGGAQYVYQPETGVLKPVDLDWWLESECDLGPGNYWLQTCWTVVAPLRPFLPGFMKQSVLAWALPPKTICQKTSEDDGNGYLFRIYAADEWPPVAGK